MPSRTPIHISSFEAVFNAAGGIERVTALTLDCGSCGARSSSDEHTLVQLPGGALFKCRHCGTHQAVSNARIAESDGATSPRLPH